MKKQQTKTVELRKQHEHAGRTYPKGAELTLPEGKADWLIGTRVAKEVGADSKADSQADAGNATA
ncbi:hypothetical protein [Acidovorax sp. Leaf78]|uniref:DUF7210 family protein n=1 Tax=Acidovorax sp. Leaf78 TaxID=1736237 RepID=UPI0006F5FBC8|nr:hypothetical protein [Acidovorax sp. Leaf78]KQO23493.1 hypothetical protein ASF16_04845 [Acidovorax sp. Leaf78]